MSETLTLTGRNLTPALLRRIADGAPVALAEEGLAAMARSATILAGAIAENRPIYGVTTGLGPRVVERLSVEEQAEMSRNTIRGRAHSVGEPLPVPMVRAAMAVRANTLLLGASGADPALAGMIAACLNTGLSPVMRATGSIGAGDLMWGGALGLGLIGEGTMDTPSGLMPAGEALSKAGLAPYQPGPREGLALVASSAPVAAFAALAAHRARLSVEATQTAAALSLEGFRANLTPLDPRVLAARPQTGQEEAAQGLRALLQGSTLNDSSQARRLQDPLSLRNLAQIHGAVFAAIAAFDSAATVEINAASDNPVVLAEAGEVLSSGGYLTPHLALTAQNMAQALVHMAAAQTARMTKLVHPRFTDLPVGLAARDSGSAGFAPAMKSAEALFSEITHLAQPPPVYPSTAADGVEDIVTHSAVPVLALGRIAERLDRLTALELMMGAQAVELRAPIEPGPILAKVITEIRKSSPRITKDRPLSDEIETLAAQVADGRFSAP